MFNEETYFVSVIYFEKKWKIINSNPIYPKFIGSFYIETILNIGIDTPIDNIIFKFIQTEAYYNSLKKDYTGKSSEMIWLETEKMNDWMFRIFRETYKRIYSGEIIISHF